MIKANEVDLRLLKKYFDNQCAPEEVSEVLQWIEQAEASKELDGEFREIWQKLKLKPGDQSRWDARLDKIHEQIEMESLYESLNVGGDTKRQKKTKDRPAVSGQVPQQEPMRRNRRHSIPIMVISFIIGMVATLYLTMPEEVVQYMPVMGQKEKSTERGQKLSFHLEDGTRVQLNANSRIIYPAKFDSLERRVVLEGEAFFEVSKDADRPFKVVTESMVTTALGTSFNINAFEDKKKIEVALVTGKASVGTVAKSMNCKAVILNPGEMVTVAKSSNSMTKATFDFQEKVAWKDGIIYFEDADYEEITQRLENWFGVNITSNRRPANWKFKNTFENETLDNILKALEFTYEFEYEIDGKDVQLKF